VESGNIEQLLAFASSSMELLLSCGVSRETSEKNLRLAQHNPETIKAFVGVHPSEALREQATGWMTEAVKIAAGVGEIGMDPKYSGASETGAQMKLYLEQLAIAERAGKPVQVHSRNAERLCIDGLCSHSLESVLLHWFEGEKELREAQDKGYFVSFGPALLYSKKLQRMATAYNRELILVESDGPLRFGPLGGVGGPQLVPSVIFKLAELRSESFHEMAARLARNSLAYLSGSRKG